MAAGDDDTVDIRSIASLVAGVDVSRLHDDELGRLVLDAEMLLNAAQSLSAVALDEFDRRACWAADGAVSAARWLAARTGTPARSVRARIRTGAGLRRLPAAVPPARAGRLSAQHLTALAACARGHDELARRDEAVLVEQAEQLDADTFVLVARHWQARADAVDSPDPTTAPDSEPVDELHLSRTIDGRYQLDGSFSAENGQLVHAALEAHVDRALRVGRDGDPSVPPVGSQVRAAALVDLAAQSMRREPSEASMPDRYRVAVVVSADTRGNLPLAACDSPAYRVVLTAEGEVLDVGRLSQAWPAGIRRAITLRDGGCVFPGCDRPPSWCDVHHCQPWSEGGRTSISNGALLCRRHHTFIHSRQWSINVETGRPVIRRPDGTPYEIRRWDIAPPCVNYGRPRAA